MWIALAIVGGLVLGVIWACLRIASEISRWEEWEHTPIKEKREHWQ